MRVTEKTVGPQKTPADTIPLWKWFQRPNSCRQRRERKPNDDISDRLLGGGRCGSLGTCSWRVSFVPDFFLPPPWRSWCIASSMSCLYHHGIVSHLRVQAVDPECLGRLFRIIMIYASWGILLWAYASRMFSPVNV